MRPALAFLVLLLVGCGRSEVVDDAPIASVPQPVAVCTSTCTTSPPRLDTPMQAAADGRPLHWATCAGCVRVSFDDQLSPSDALTLLAAVKDWQRAAGESLCLTLDRKASSALTAADLQRIHVARTATKSPVSQLTTVTFDVKTGRLQQALLEVGDSLPLDRQLAAGLGRALGLGTGADDVVSAVTTRADGLTKAGPADINSLRAMYGGKPWCNVR